MPRALIATHTPLDRGRPMPDSGSVAITFVFPEGQDTLAEQMRTLVHPDGLWSQHSGSPAVWVECDDGTLGSAIAEHFSCPVGRPDDWPA